ncbi:DUF1285 domain-containing protein [Brucella pituitosa]|uniref:DUF1285 domain-containing protein n=1 Tax=Brucella pituitosa TaxID=571256 RepID=A0ABS3JYV7_9HYPH|nr:DUF1285 domain-containing protein [Brucella pituitosa]MBO1039832.1 DUF1285 domain-containing protein [Brucella pituitosa]
MTKSTPNGKHEPQSSMKAAASAGGLEALIARAHADAHSGPATKERGIPPVERWNPEFCGDLDMEIRADGTWFYMGTPIGRPQLVRLFSTVLRKDEDGKTYLVTPVEKVGIRVEEAHFIAVEMQVSGEGEAQKLTLRTNVGDVIEVGDEHPLRFIIEKNSGGLKPYVLVRGRLEALLTRAVMYDLVALGEEIGVDGVSMFAVRSNGVIFPIMPTDALEVALQ